ncbi:CBASS oligonucleotide cyclase [Mesorhizobium sp. LNJC405B00]|uniref:CBASS oligonucleotide cyclase n=1 Tax=Mesorhizobium sp. LNJC405B00 TaxID=1287281 RepID=UPI0003CF0341|nr:CBASS oligonucleotide cyclase [Mesorhizobium sp. LNJC405B00]ESY01401.1 nucleotidyltransferase [Mesorhizobium sp. LNJC405B00]
MPLTNTALLNYDHNVLRLPSDKRTQYHAQVDRLVTELNKTLKGRTDIKITRVLKAGSFAKFTILRRTNEDPVDVDLVIYVSGDNVDGSTLEQLVDAIHKALIDIYPTKSVEDFEIQRKAATVTFAGTGLSVDVVPIIEDPDRPGYGWQFDIRDGTKVETNPPGQLKFVRDRKDADKNFRTLVRIGKRWRRHAELEALKGFHIELIMAHVFEVNGNSGSIEKRFRDFLLYIAQSGLKEEIRFPENTGPYVTFSDPVVILDPVNSQNNVTSRITEAEREEIVAAANTAWEAAHYASAENDNDVWKEVFGPRFSTEEAA